MGREFIYSAVGFKTGTVFIYALASHERGGAGIACAGVEL